MYIYICMFILSIQHPNSSCTVDTKSWLKSNQHQSCRNSHQSPGSSQPLFNGRRNETLTLIMPDRLLLFILPSSSIFTGSKPQERSKTLTLNISRLIAHNTIQHYPKTSKNQKNTSLKSITFNYMFKLSTSSMCCDFGPQVTQAFVDKGCSHLGLGLSNICLSEEELPVQIGDVNGVHVNDMNVLRHGSKTPPTSDVWASFSAENSWNINEWWKKRTFFQWLVRSAKQPWNRTMLNLSEFRIPSHQHRWPESYSFLASSQWSQLLVRKHLHRRRDFFATARDRHGRVSGYPTQTWSREVASSENLDCLWFELYMASAVRKELPWSQSGERGCLVFILTRTKEV